MVLKKRTMWSSIIVPSRQCCTPQKKIQMETSNINKKWKKIISNNPKLKPKQRFLYLPSTIRSERTSEHLQKGLHICSLTIFASTAFKYQFSLANQYLKCEIKEKLATIDRDLAARVLPMGPTFVMLESKVFNSTLACSIWQAHRQETITSTFLRRVLTRCYKKTYDKRFSQI